MIKIIPNLIPKNNTKFGIAFSGGVDSVVFSHFLKQGNKNFDLYFFNHGDDNDMQALEFAKEWADKLKVQLHTNDVVTQLKASESIWRASRYDWLESFKNTPIITGHNLEDIVSGYIMFWIKGQEKFIPVERNNIKRPFLLASKEDIFKYARKHNLYWHEEDYNHDLSFDRVKVNKKVLPSIYEINPNFDNKIKNMFIEKLKRENYL